jgi:hypothetical protein
VLFRSPQNPKTPVVIYSDLIKIKVMRHSQHR